MTDNFQAKFINEDSVSFLDILMFIARQLRVIMFFTLIFCVVSVIYVKYQVSYEGEFPFEGKRNNFTGECVRTSKSDFLEKIYDNEIEFESNCLTDEHVLKSSYPRCRHENGNYYYELIN